MTQPDPPLIEWLPSLPDPRRGSHRSNLVRRLAWEGERAFDDLFDRVDAWFKSGALSEVEKFLRDLTVRRDLTPEVRVAVLTATLPCRTSSKRRRGFVEASRAPLAAVGAGAVLRDLA